MNTTASTLSYRTISSAHHRFASSVTAMLFVLTDALDQSVAGHDRHANIRDRRVVKEWQIAFFLPVWLSW
jgi:hypothetical protein